MLTFRRVFCLGLPVILTVASLSPVLAQTADADQARALLQQGIKQYAALSFEQAKNTFLTVDSDKLSDADRKVLDDHLTRADTAIRAQRAAREAYDSATEALKNNDFSKAQKGFAQASASEFLPAETRLDAKAQLAAVARRIQASQAARNDSLLPAVPTAKKPSAEPVVAPAAEPEPAADEPVVTTDVPAPSDPKARKVLAEASQRRTRAMELVASGKAALADAEPEQAVMYFERALSLSPDLEEAQVQLTIARGLSGNGGDGGILTRAQRYRQIAQQAARVDFAKAMTQSNAALAAAESTGAFAGAMDAANVAKTVLESRKTVFSAADYREMSAVVDQQIESIRHGRQTWERIQAGIKIQEVERAEHHRKAKEAEQLTRRIGTLRQHAKTLRGEHKYSESIQVYEQILRLDPADDGAADQKEWLEQMLLDFDEGKTYRNFYREEQKSLADLKRSQIPWYELLRYPQDWVELTVRRQGISATAGADSEEDRKVYERLNQHLPRLDFEDTEFQLVVGFLREVSGVNIYVNWPALMAVGIEKDTPVNVHLSNVTLKKALQVILDDVGGMNELTYTIEEGVITISTRDDLSQRTIVHVYDIRDMIVRVPIFIAPRMSLTGGSEVSDAGYEAAGGEEGGVAEEGALSKRDMINQIRDLIMATIDPDSWRPIGTIGAIEELSGQLVVTQTAENHAAVLALINKLRETRAIQIAIEARFISVNTGFLNSIGIDLDFYFNLGSRLGSTTGTDPWTGATVPGMGGTSGWPGAPGTNRLTPIQAGQDSSFANMIGTTTGMTNSIGGAGGVLSPALNISGAFLDDIQVDFLIEATQAHQSTRSLTAPRLTLYNGQRAYVMVSEQQAYVSDLDPTVAENAIAYDVTVEYVSTGAVLDVEATVSADRRYITMTLRPQVTSLNSFTRYAIDAEVDAAGNIIVGQGFIQLPNVTIQEVLTTVSVPDGGTLLIGGQKLSREVEREIGVPLLSKIPIINRAFTNRGTVRDEETLLILVKPKIIIHREEEIRHFPGVQ